MDVTVVPRLGCNMPRLAVLGGRPMTTPAIQRAPKTPVTPPAPRTPESEPTPDPRRPPVRFLPPFDFGMEIDCGDCDWKREPDGTPIFYASRQPRVLSVEPGGPADQAGLRPRDVLLKVNGEPFISREAAVLLGEIVPDQTVTLEVGRAGSLRTVRIVPRRAVPRGQHF
jgi:hypothetical protein